MTPRRWRLVGVLALVVVTSGCGGIAGSDLLTMSNVYLNLADQLAKQRIATLGLVRSVSGLVGGLCVVLALWSGKKIHSGEPWNRVCNEWIFGALFALWILGGLGAQGQGYDISLWIPQLGTDVSKMNGIAPPQDWMKGYLGETALTATKILNLKSAAANIAAGALNPLSFDFEALANVWLSEFTVGFVAINSLFLFFADFFMTMSYAILILLCRSVLPLVVPTLLFERSRPVFYAWLKFYIGLSCWPIALNLLRSILAALPWPLLFSPVGGNVLEIGADLVMRVSILCMVNIILVLMYIAAPAMCHRIVNGSQQFVKGGFF